MPGRELEHAAVGRDGLFVAIEGREHEAAIVVKFGLPGNELHGALDQRQRLGKL